MSQELKGLIFNVQRFSLHDGEGIRTVVFFKGCPLSCKWCANPESQSFSQELRYDPKFCIGCKSCVSACPAGALHLDPAQGIRRDTDLCRACFSCALACPAKSFIKEGREVTVDELIEEISSDKVFFDSSKGGVTFSGGEALAQPEFLIALLKKLKEQNYNVCIETCLYAPTQTVKEVIPFVDTFLCDIKHVDSEKHKQYVGETPDLILENLKYIISSGREVIARIPVIPGFNHDEDSMRRISAKLGELGVKNVNLLPFHQLGENKYLQLGRPYELRGVKALRPEDLNPYVPVFEAEGIHAQIGG
ncbi:MAG: glycyl-radical enzyme activating protein [Christensenellales bacterium]